MSFLDSNGVQTLWNAAKKTFLNSSSKLNASNVTEGTLPLSVIPSAALERLFTANTSDDLVKVLNKADAGDTVQNTSSTPIEVYIKDGSYAEINASDGKAQLPDGALRYTFTPNSMYRLDEDKVPHEYAAGIASRALSADTATSATKATTADTANALIESAVDDIISKAVAATPKTDLSNYYKKSETLSTSEINNKLDQIDHITYPMTKDGMAAFALIGKGANWLRNIDLEEYGGFGVEFNNANVFRTIWGASVDIPKITTTAILNYIDGKATSIVELNNNGVEVEFIDGTTIDSDAYTGGTYDDNKNVKDIKVTVAGHVMRLYPGKVLNMPWAPANPQHQISNIDMHNTDNMLSIKHYAGETNTSALVANFGDAKNYAAGYANGIEFRAADGETPKHGYLPGIDELYMLTNFAGKINRIYHKLSTDSNNLIGDTMYGGKDAGNYFLWSSTQFDASGAWGLGGDGGAGGGDWDGGGSGVLVFLANS